MANKKIFYRFQNTLEIEKESYFIDIQLAYEDFYEFSNEFSNESELFNYVLSRYYKSFALRKDITPDGLLSLIKNSTQKEVDELTYKYKIPYIFGYKKEYIEDDYTMEDILNEETRPGFWHCENDTYLTVYEGEEILDEDESGVLFNPTKILGYYTNNVFSVCNICEIKPIIYHEVS